MIKPAGAERRQHTRYAVMGEVPGKYTDKDGTELTVVLVDLSKHGFGILIDSKLETGAIVLLEVEEKVKEPIKLKVQWIAKVEPIGPTAMYRCGLRAVETSLDLEKLFRSFDSVILDDLS